MKRSLRSLFRFVVLSVQGVLLLSCANQIPPSGGPIDTSPPTIIATYPAPYTLHFSDKRLTLEFDKYVDHRSAEESIFISPFIDDIEFDWSGKEVDMTFPGRLRKNTTYVVNIGTDVRDLRSPPNRMAQAYTLAFSTGGDIDRGGIRGRIFPVKSTDPPEGVMVFAYQLAGRNPDTLSPRTLKPDYVTQTGKNGYFFLQHLSFGPYRVVAVRDEYRNLLYDPQVDEFGVPPRDMVLSEVDTLVDNVFLQMSREDTTAPRLVRVDPSDDHHLTVDFSEPIDTVSTKPMKVSIVDTIAGTRLKVFSFYPKLPSLSSFVAVTDKQDSTRGYEFTVDSAQDLVGLAMDRKANAISFLGSPNEDTLRPRISTMSIRDSLRGVKLSPTILIQFSDAVHHESIAGEVSLEDSSNKDVSATLAWLNDAACTLRVHHEFSGKSWYVLKLVTYDAVDWSGRKFKDSLKVVRFETLDTDSLSSIEGTVADTNTADPDGSIFVIADDVVANKKESYTTRTNQKGDFFIGGILEGRYVVRAFKDRNSNGKFDAGLPVPYTRSERFGFLDDTLKVRARWPLEGVRIELK